MTRNGEYEASGGLEYNILKVVPYIMALVGELAGPIAKEISEEYGIEPKRTYSLLDIFSSVGQGIIPYGGERNFIYNI